MGYEYEPVLYRLKFEKRPGLEILAGSLSVAEFLDIASLADKVQADKTDAASAGKMFAMFAAALDSWNLTRKGEPVPATAAGVHSLDLDFALELIMAWMEAIGSVGESSPLANGSRSGASSALEASLPMESLSASLPS